MRDSLRHFVAEFVGTFALVFVGGAAIMSVTMSGGQTGPGVGGLVAVALAHGLILSLFVTATMRVSGHLNPAVTVGFLATRRIEPVMAGVYVAAQLLGAMLAAYLLKGTFPADVVAATRAGGQSVAIDVSGMQAFLLEAIATFFLVFVVFGTAVDPRAPQVGGFAIGLTVAADILAIGPRTGASMNPARSLGPAVATGIFEGQLIYWAGPIVGGLVAALLYDRLFLPRGPEPVDHGAREPAAGTGKRKKVV
jgi:MIP family channel proteins